MFYARTLTPTMVDVLKASNGMDSTLLITGSTGTGKSYLAERMHKESGRAPSGRWFKINLATLSENLVESELFGHERGAFTGADIRRVGRLESCNGGTVFLDEIGELPIRLQAKLLDFIQYKKITPVGSNREIGLDVRIIAATNKNLELSVKKGEFRADLFHRLNVFHVRLPDLAMAPSNIMPLAFDILAKITAETGKRVNGFSEMAESALRKHLWPGNIRELENSIEYAVAMATSERIEYSNLPPAVRNVEQVQSFATALEVEAFSDAFACLELPISMSFHDSKDKFERAYLERVLRLCGGQINLTSRQIGLNKVSLSDKIKKYGINWRQIRYEAASGGAIIEGGAAALLPA